MDALITVLRLMEAGVDHTFKETFVSICLLPSSISEPFLNFTLEPGNSEKIVPPPIFKETPSPGILGYLPTPTFWCL